MKKVLLATGGGAASAVVGALYKLQGYDVHLCHIDFTGVPEQLTPRHSKPHTLELSKVLDLPFIEIKAGKQAGDYLKRFVSLSYRTNRNPDFRCVSWDSFMINLLNEKVLEGRFDSLATGHFGKIIRDETASFTEIHRSAELSVDQSGRLAFFNNDQLEFLECPLGDFKMDNINKMVNKFELPCYISFETRKLNFESNNMENAHKYFKELIPMNLGANGTVRDIDNSIIGNHKGAYQFTSGCQIKDELHVRLNPVNRVLQIEPDRMIVYCVDPEKFKPTRILLDKMIWRDKAQCKAPLRVECNLPGTESSFEGQLIRYPGGCGELLVEDTGFLSYPGHPMVFYLKEKVLASGWVEILKNSPPAIAHIMNPQLIDQRSPN